MSRDVSAKAGGIMLIVASVLGVAAMTLFSPNSSSGPSPASHVVGAGPASGGASAAPNVPAPPTRRDSAGMFVVPSTEPVIEHIESPFTREATDSVAAACVAKVQAARIAGGGDTSGVVAVERYGVHPIPGRGRDSLIVDGTAPGRDDTRAVWHCAATTSIDERVGVVRFVIEDGWPGVPSRFQSAHPINVTAEDLCLKRTEPLFPESDFRSVKRWRVADTLHVTGETMPINSGDLSGDFHCRAVVRDGAIVSVVSRSGRG